MSICWKSVGHFVISSYTKKCIRSFWKCVSVRYTHKQKNNTVRQKISTERKIKTEVIPVFRRHFVCLIALILSGNQEKKTTEVNYIKVLNELSSNLNQTRKETKNNTHTHTKWNGSTERHQDRSATEPSVRHNTDKQPAIKRHFSEANKQKRNNNYF